MNKIMGIALLVLMLTGCESPEDEARANKLAREACAQYNSIPLTVGINPFDDSVYVKCVNTATGNTFQVTGVTL